MAESPDKPVATEHGRVGELAVSIVGGISYVKRCQNRPRSRWSRSFESKVIGEAGRECDRPGVGLARPEDRDRPQGRSRVDARRVPCGPYEALLRVDKDAPVLVEHVIKAALDDDAERGLIC